jgi:hypothetical protein
VKEKLIRLASSYLKSAACPVKVHRGALLAYLREALPDDLPDDLGLRQMRALAKEVALIGLQALAEARRRQREYRHNLFVWAWESSDSVVEASDKLTERGYWSMSPERTQRFATWMRRKYGLDLTELPMEMVE